MARLKASYRSWAIPCAGEQVYAARHRAEWLAKINEVGVRRRAEFYYQQFDALAALRQVARRELLQESRKHFAVPLLRQIPMIGPIRAALLVALIQTPHRFRTKRQFWSYNLARQCETRQRGLRSPGQACFVEILKKNRIIVRNESANEKFSTRRSSCLLL
jgi:transposase